MSADEQTAARPRRAAARVSIALLVLMLVVFWARQVAPITGQSQTFDEAAQLAAGYVQLAHGFYPCNSGHPPLINMLHALALAPVKPQFTIDPKSWRLLDMWAAGNQFLYESNPNPLAMLVLARLSTLVLASLLVVLAFAWSRRIFGPWAGALTAFLLTFDPNLLAHSGLSTTDVAITALMMPAIYCMWRYLSCGRPGWIAAMGLTFGAACAGKLNALLLFPMLAAGIVLVEPGQPDRRPAFTARILGRRALLMIEVVAIVAVLAGLVIWATYRLQVGTLAETTRYDDTMRKLVAGGFPVALARLKIPAPWYWWGLAFQHLRPLSLGPYLLGYRLTEPTRLYAPVTFLLKTPLPGLLLLAFAGMLAGRPGRWCDKVVLYGGVLVLAGAPVLLPTSPGYRHLLPAMPLAAIALGGYVRPRRSVRWAKVFLAAMLVWFAAESLSVHPHYLAYFNQIAGGPSGGYRYLVDSDLDWGQDLPGLKRYLDEHRIEKVYLDYFGTALPQYYGITNWVPLSSAEEPVLAPGEDPDRVVIAISATQLQCTGPTWPFSRAPVLYSWLKPRRPIAAVGHSIFIYRLRAATDRAPG